MNERSATSGFQSHLPPGGPPGEGKTLYWIGAVSFEERCSGSLQVLAASERRVARAYVLRYATTVVGARDLEERRNRRMDSMVSMLAKSGCKDIIDREVDAYGSRDTAEVVEQCVGRLSPNDELVVDITCLTKITAITACGRLATRGGTACVAYTLPRVYGGMAENRRDFGGWRSSVIMPLGREPRSLDEGKSRGIVVPGHESHRLTIALGDIEPSGGCLVRAITPDRPDFEAVTASRNRRLIETFVGRRGWKEQRVVFTDSSTMRELVALEAAVARQNQGPLYLYLLGPKSLLASGVMSAVSEYPEGSWIVYPAPSFYDAEYSSGIGTTYWWHVTTR